MCCDKFYDATNTHTHRRTTCTVTRTIHTIHTMYTSTLGAGFSESERANARRVFTAPSFDSWGQVRQGTVVEFKYQGLTDLGEFY